MKFTLIILHFCILLSTILCICVVLSGVKWSLHMLFENACIDVVCYLNEENKRTNKKQSLVFRRVIVSSTLTYSKHTFPCICAILTQYIFIFTSYNSKSKNVSTKTLVTKKILVKSKGLSNPNFGVPKF